MTLSDFRRAGHVPTLLTAFLYFDVSFMVWLLPGALANAIVPDFGLTDAQKGLMVAVPLLGGAFLRLLLGLLAELAPRSPAVIVIGEVVRQAACDDAQDPESIARAVDAFGKVDVMVSNAGICPINCR